MVSCSISIEFNVMVDCWMRLRDLVAYHSLRMLPCLSKMSLSFLKSNSYLSFSKLMSSGYCKDLSLPHKLRKRIPRSICYSSIEMYRGSFFSLIHVRTRVLSFSLHMGHWNLDWSHTQMQSLWNWWSTLHGSTTVSDTVRSSWQIEQCLEMLLVISSYIWIDELRCRKTESGADIPMSSTNNDSLLRTQ